MSKFCAVPATTLGLAILASAMLVLLEPADTNHALVEGRTVVPGSGAAGSVMAVGDEIDAEDIRVPMRQYVVTPKS